MKKVFLFLVVAGFVFASCGRRASSEQETCVKDIRCCSPEVFIIEEEIIVFDDENHVE